MAMIITQLKAHRVGPFYEPFEIDLDKRVTILTGANDVGKSSLLLVLELLFNEGTAPERFVNMDWLQEAPGAWPDDPSIIVGATINLTDPEDIVGRAILKIAPGDLSRISRRLAKNAGETIVNTQTAQLGASAHKIVFPTVLKPGGRPGTEIHEEIDLNKPTDLELALLNAAFSNAFNLSKLAALNDINFTRQVEAAENTLNQLLKRAFPQPANLRFRLTPVAGDRARLAVLVRDRHDSVTPFGNRGGGVRRLITLMAELITSDRTKHRLVLLDEPENSLHADAQHLFREFLFDLTSDGRTQVVYATHSPAMINPMRAEQVRLLVREKSGVTATTKVQPQAERSSFLGLRTSLGISAADSLLFAPVTVITEGETEVGCLPTLIRKLEDSEAFRALDARRILGLTTFLDGMGDSFEYLCRLVKAYGARAVLFLDGDKESRVGDVRRKHPEVPIIMLPETSEFEQIVPPLIYLKAVAEVSAQPLPTDPEDELRKWTDADTRRQKRAFSKRVQGWFEDTFAADFPRKRIVMQKALDLAGLNEINGAPIEQLLNAVREQLKAISL